MSADRSSSRTPRAVAVFVAALVVCSAALDASPASAQASLSFHVTDAMLDAGGGVSPPPSSASFRITRASLGVPFAAVTSSGPGIRLDGGVLAATRPAGEVRGLNFTGPTTLSWSADPSLGDYAVYRGALDTLPRSFGDCFAHGMAMPLCDDPAVPGAGAGTFYLVTARDRLHREGTKGATSDGTPRANDVPCP